MCLSDGDSQDEEEEILECNIIDGFLVCANLPKKAIVIGLGSKIGD